MHIGVRTAISAIAAGGAALTAYRTLDDRVDSVPLKIAVAAAAGGVAATGAAYLTRTAHAGTMAAVAAVGLLGSACAKLPSEQSLEDLEPIGEDGRRNSFQLWALSSQPLTEAVEDAKAVQEAGTFREQAGGAGSNRSYVQTPVGDHLLFVRQRGDAFSVERDVGAVSTLTGEDIAQQVPAGTKFVLYPKSRGGDIVAIESDRTSHPAAIGDVLPHVSTTPADAALGDIDLSDYRYLEGQSIELGAEPGTAVLGRFVAEVPRADDRAIQANLPADGLRRIADGDLPGYIVVKNSDVGSENGEPTRYIYEIASAQNAGREPTLGHWSDVGSPEVYGVVMPRFAESKETTNAGTQYRQRSEVVFQRIPENGWDAYLSDYTTTPLIADDWSEPVFVPDGDGAQQARLEQDTVDRNAEVMQALLNAPSLEYLAEARDYHGDDDEMPREGDGWSWRDTINSIGEFNQAWDTVFNGGYGLDNSVSVRTIND